MVVGPLADGGGGVFSVGSYQQIQDEGRTVGIAPEKTHPTTNSIMGIESHLYNFLKESTPYKFIMLKKLDNP